MNDQLSLLEIGTIVASAFGCGYALLMTGGTPRQLWRGPVAAFGCGILSMGIAGMTSAFYNGLRANIDGSLSTRGQVFDEIMANAWRPMLIAIIGMMAFVAVVRSTAAGDDERAPSVGGPIAMVMLIGTALALIGTGAYLTGFVTSEDPTQPTAVMYYTYVVSGLTAVVCAIGGVWTGVAANRWNAEQA